MRDSELQILEQYDIDVRTVRKVRDAMLCETDKGLFLVKELKMSEKRLSTLEWIGLYLQKQGYENVDRILRTEAGELVSVSVEENKFYLKRWFSGKECDIYREKDVLDAVANLTRIHSLLRYVEDEEEAVNVSEGEDLRQEYFRHNREMKKVRSFMRERAGKGNFENAYLKHFDAQYEWAFCALERLNNSHYGQMLEEVRNRCIMIHGDYNYHNVLMTYGGMATTNFNRLQQNIQVIDFYYFLRKVMEKHHWDVNLGDRILDCYQKYLPFQEGELELIAICLAYPEKFWKVANSYHRSRKIWIPAKNLEKLELVIKQTEEKRKFLETIFSFHL
jgi:CotS family spore coat protein